MIEFKPTQKSKKPEKEVVSIRLESEMLKQVDKYADKSELSRNEFLVQSIDFALKYFSDKDQ